jgi:hypothetical protein
MMNEHSIKIQGRRKLFIRGLRNATLGLLTAAGGFAFVKRRRLLREGKCINQGICEGCEVFKECGLPRALSVKSVLARKSNDG